MSLNLKLAFVCGLSLFLFSCAHHKDVRVGSDGINTITVQFTDDGLKDASRQSTQYCMRLNGSPVYLNGDPNFTADMDKKKTDSKDGLYTVQFKCDLKKSLLMNL